MLSAKAMPEKCKEQVLEKKHLEWELLGLKATQLRWNPRVDARPNGEVQASVKREEW